MLERSIKRKFESLTIWVVNIENLLFDKSNSYKWLKLNREFGREVISLSLKSNLISFDLLLLRITIDISSSIFSKIFKKLNEIN